MLDDYFKTNPGGQRFALTRDWTTASQSSAICHSHVLKRPQDGKLGFYYGDARPVFMDQEIAFAILCLMMRSHGEPQKNSNIIKAIFVSGWVDSTWLFVNKNAKSNQKICTRSWLHKQFSICKHKLEEKIYTKLGESDVPNLLLYKFRW